ncbi:Uncharacterised protein [Helicobacter pametensis]|nr:Uncharacterised protein [Helicobacter pametensis]
MLNIMSNCCALDIDLDDVFKRIINRFFDCIRHFFGFSQTKSNKSIFVSNDNKGIETESSTTFYNFCYTPNIYDNFAKFFSIDFHIHPL